jgi:hypothetical protein
MVRGTGRGTPPNEEPKPTTANKPKPTIRKENIMKTTTKCQNHPTFEIHLVAPAHERPREEGNDLDTLIRRAAGGDREAIGTFARQLRPQLVAEARAACRRRGGRAYDAEDIVQDLFLFLLSGEARTLPRPGRGVVWVAQVIQYLAARRADARAREEDWIRETMERRRE